ncbi:MAG: 4-hydroxybenzoate 3-monooxygenase [Chloroflexi bacterium]|nr:MAG: 4-hydroxybenzoate 3-monooxygenase [Chloroflexota bacterium]
MSVSPALSHPRSRGRVGVGAETQVGIIGAGPAGLMLSHLLHLQGIESVVLETRSRDYVEARVRAGVLEQGSADLLSSAGVGDRMRREGLVHDGIKLRFEGEEHRIDFRALTGRGITVYGQQEVVKDLIQRRLDDGGQIWFDTQATSIDGIEDHPSVSYCRDGKALRLSCDFIAGCDGSHGISNGGGESRTYERSYPFAWLGVLAKTPPATDELIYAYHDRGFALHSMRTPEISRLYLQVDADETMANWPEDRIWSELRLRLAEPHLQPGEIIEDGITPMRSLVIEPMQSAWYRSGLRDQLDRYSEQCLRRVWRAEQFSAWMTGLLHRDQGGDPFEHKLRLSYLRYVTTSTAAATTLAENYVGYDQLDRRR